MKVLPYSSRKATLQFPDGSELAAEGYIVQLVAAYQVAYGMNSLDDVQNVDELADALLTHRTRLYVAETDIIDRFAKQARETLAQARSDTDREG